MPRPPTPPDTHEAIAADLQAGTTWSVIQARYHVGRDTIAAVARSLTGLPMGATTEAIQARIVAGDSDYRIALDLHVSRNRVAAVRREMGVEPVKRKGRKKICADPLRVSD
jgi:hypothetical protein